MPCSPRYVISEGLALLAHEMVFAPVSEANIFTYFYGRRLLEPILQGPQRQEHLHQLLTEQIAPSYL